MKYNDNGTYKDIFVKVFDTLPVGAEVDFDGQTVPSGWTEITEVKDVQTILDLNWVNQSKQVTVEDGYMYIVFIGWASSCLLFQYANGTALTRQIMGSNTYTQSKTDDTYTFTIDNTGLMYGIKVKITS